MKRYFLSLTSPVVLLVGSLLVAQSPACETEKDAASADAPVVCQCPNPSASPCCQPQKQTPCDAEADGDYWYDSQTGEYREYHFSSDWADQEDYYDGCDDDYEYYAWDEEEESYFEEESTELVEQEEETASGPATEAVADQSRSDDGGSYDDQWEEWYECDGYGEYWEEYLDEEEVVIADSAEEYEAGDLGSESDLEYWVDIEMTRLVKGSKRAKNRCARYDAGDLGCPKDLAYWVDAEFDQIVSQSESENRQMQVASREAVLSVARTLDEVGSLLQAISQHLREMAAPEVAQQPVWIDETTQR